MKSILKLLILLTLFGLISSSSLSVNGYCGDPGSPKKSRLVPTQKTYNEGEMITYTCDDFISMEQIRKCVKGKWRGKQAVCGETLQDNDLIRAKIYNKIDGSLIKEYDTNKLLEFGKFYNSFVAERLEQPLRVSGYKSYRFELQLRRKDMFQLVHFSPSVVNYLVDDRIRRSHFNITKVTSSPYRECRFHSQTYVHPWLHNSTRIDFWFMCESKDNESFEREIKDKSNLITVETESDYELELDLATFVLARPYTNNGNDREPVCGSPEEPIGMKNEIVNHNVRYSYKCRPGFKNLDTGPQLGDIPSNSNILFCGTDMKWKGTLPKCLPEKTCKKFDTNEDNLTEVYLYERVYYYNDSLWFPIEGTKAHFRCKNEKQIFVGKEISECDKNGEWSESLSNCLDKGFAVRESKTDLLTVFLIIGFILIVVFGLIAIIIYFVIRMKKIDSNQTNSLRMRRSHTDSEDHYDIGRHGKGMDETYDMVYDSLMRGQGYKFNYKDKNVYDDIGNDFDDGNYQSLGPDLEESYVVMEKV